MVNYAEEYSAGLVSQCFWFVEMKQMVKLVYSGLSWEEIKQKCVTENLFGVEKEYRAKELYGRLSTRIKSMDAKLMELFMTSDLATQKIINYILILRRDKLYLEFLNEVYREKILLGAEVLESSDIKVFFTYKEQEHEDVAKWKDYTKKRLGSGYVNYMVDAGLITLVGNEKRLTAPILDIALERYLSNNGETVMIKALTGGK